jgi:hypothetical protein
MRVHSSPTATALIPTRLLHSSQPDYCRQTLAEGRRPLRGAEVRPAILNRQRPHGQTPVSAGKDGSVHVDSNSTSLKSYQSANSLTDTIDTCLYTNTCEEW